MRLMKWSKLVPDHAWCQYNLDGDAIKKLDASLLTILAYGRDHEVSVIGNAFAVYGHENVALCLTAAHCLEHSKRLQGSQPRHHPTFPSDFHSTATRHVDPKNIAAFCVIDGQPVVCAVKQLCYVEGYDVAVFSAQSS